MYIFGQKTSDGKIVVETQIFDITGISSDILTSGFEVDSVPLADNVSGKSSITYYDPVAKQFSFEYIDRPLTDNELIKNLQAQNAQMLMSLVKGGLM